MAGELEVELACEFRFVFIKVFSPAYWLSKSSLNFFWMQSVLVSKHTWRDWSKLLAGGGMSYKLKSMAV